MPAADLTADAHVYIVGPPYVTGPSLPAMAALHLIAGSVSVRPQAREREARTLEGGWAHVIGTGQSLTASFNDTLVDADQPIRPMLARSKEWDLLVQYPTGSEIVGTTHPNWGDACDLVKGLWQPVGVEIPTDDLVNLTGSMTQRAAPWHGHHVFTWEGTRAEWEARSPLDVDIISSQEVGVDYDYSRPIYVGLLIHRITLAAGSIKRVGYTQSYHRTPDLVRVSSTPQAFYLDTVVASGNKTNLGLVINQVAINAPDTDEVVRLSAFAPATGQLVNYGWSSGKFSVFILQPVEG